MWPCVSCGEALEDQFDSCWRCGRQAQSLAIGRGGAASSASGFSGQDAPIICPKCRGEILQAEEAGFVVARCPLCGFQETVAGPTHFSHRRPTARKTALAFAIGGATALAGIAATVKLIEPVGITGFILGFGGSSLIGGLLAGIAGGLNLWSAVAFGLSFVLPGMICAPLAVAMAGPSVWFLIGFPIWAATFGLAGAFGAAFLGLSNEDFRRVSNAFLLGGALGGGLLLIAPSRPRGRPHRSP